MKKFTCLLLALAMCLGLSVSAAAEELPRIEIVLDNESQITEFFHSPEYDPDTLYTFIIPSQKQARILCPSCGRNNYRGVTEHREMDIIPRMCPASPDFENDLCTRMDVYTYSKCDSCGYKTSASFLNRYWLVACHIETWNGGETYIARPGQSYQQGYDFHEDPVYMNLM